MSGREPWRRGYTMLELATVLVILGGLAGIALPPFTSSRARMAVRHAADEFLASHSLTKAIAVWHGGVGELHIDAAAGRFWVEMDTSVNRTGATDTIGTVRNIWADGVTMTSTRAKLCFDARGLATPIPNCPPGDATLVFSRPGGYADTVVTTRLGKVLR